jgi:hypothetical protein
MTPTMLTTLTGCWIGWSARCDQYDPSGRL